MTWDRCLFCFNLPILHLHKLLPYRVWWNNSYISRTHYCSLSQYNLLGIIHLFYLLCPSWVFYISLSHFLPKVNLFLEKQFNYSHQSEHTGKNHPNFTNAMHMLHFLILFSGQVDSLIPLFAAEKTHNSKRQLMLLKEEECFMMRYISRHNRLMLPVPEPATEI